MRQAWRIIMGVWAIGGLVGCASEVGGPDVPEVGSTGAALIGPEGDLNDFPPWVWPYIRTAAIFTRAMSGAIAIDEAHVAMKAAAEDCGCALASQHAGVETVLAAIATTFDTQYATARLAMTAGEAKAAEGKLAFIEGDDYCGNGLPEIPWPRPRGLYELLLRERELIGEAILSNAELDKRGRDAVNAALDRQVERFKQLEL